MARISDSIIDDIQQRVDIAEVIGRYVPLKRAGRDFKANCPFHKEKSPSFLVNPEKQIFHCFGCGVGGNVFSFLMQHDRLTFPEAVRLLADQAGVHIEDAAAGGSSKAPNNHEDLFTLLDKASRYYERTLHAAPAKEVHSYIQQRGISEETCKAFRLGFAPAGWGHLKEAAQTTGVTEGQLEAVGLAIPGKSGSYDRFRNRVLFPISDIRGRIIGFGGRSFDGQEPKYLNSPETVLYSKGRQLFGLFQARDAVISKKTAVLVEGYFDCAVLASAGIQNVISPLGTALTPEQGRLLKRYADHVILAFDADAAGEQATLRGIEVLVELGLQVSVAKLPQGVDPDEYVLQHGKESFEKLLEESLSIFEFIVAAALNKFPKKQVEEVVKAAQFVLPFILKVPDAILRREYIRRLANRLHLDEAAILSELSKLGGKEARMPAAIQGAPQARAATVRVSVKGPEALLVAMVLAAPQRWLSARSQIELDQIADSGLRRVLSVVDALLACAGKAEAVTTSMIISRLVSSGEEPLAAALMQLLQSAPVNEAVFKDCLIRLKEKNLKRQADNKRAEIQNAQDQGQTKNMQQLLSEYQQLMVQSKGE